MSPFIKSASLTCASLGILVFTHCGGGSSDVEGKAPSESFIYNNGANITCALQDTATIYALLADNILPPIFTITTIADIGTISDENQQLQSWNDRTGTVTYTKTGRDKATISIQEITTSAIVKKDGIMPILDGTSAFSTPLFAFQAAGGDDDMTTTSLLSITSEIKFTTDTQGRGKTTIQVSPANHQGTQTLESDTIFTIDYSLNNNND